jgi:ribosome maturation factor RimP
MDLNERIEKIIEEPLDFRGYEVVRVQLSGNKRLHLQVMIDRKDEVPVNVDDCALASRCISSLLDVEDPIQGAYTLEVSSPGLDRPLVKPKDFIKYAGHKISLQTHLPIQGRKNFAGQLTQADDKEIVLELSHPNPSGEVLQKFAYPEVRNAKLEIEF